MNAFVHQFGSPIVNLLPEVSAFKMDPENLLENFRQEWKNEIDSGSRRETSNINESSISNKNSEKEFNETEDELRSASFYSHGVWLEDHGEVYEAIKYYRKAISLDPDIEFKVFPEKDLENHVSHNKEVNIDLEDGSFYDDEDLLSRFEKLLINKPICQPMFSQSSTHISKLPNEMFHKILLWVISDELDMQSLDSLSSVCRGFYLLCRNSNIWKTACLNIWGHKGCQSTENEEALFAGYASFREMFLLRPRLRLNGCYISRTTYYRKADSGFQDESYEPYQCVNYYRYLRFFANGIVLMLTSAEPPQAMVGLLKKKDTTNALVMTGRYMITGNFVSMNFRIPPKKKIIKSRNRIISNGTTDVAKTCISIDMLIQPIKKRQNWQLTWQNYVIKSYFLSGKMSTASIDAKDSINFPPLLFSRVKSYCLESDSPLA